MEDNKLPHRTNEIYREIERFNKYELTNCIAFEMAIRNREISKQFLKIYFLPTISDERTDVDHPQKEFLEQKLKEKYCLGIDCILYLRDILKTFTLRENIRFISSIYYRWEWLVEDESNKEKIANEFGFKNFEEMAKYSKIEINDVSENFIKIINFVKNKYKNKILSINKHLKGHIEKNLEILANYPNTINTNGSLSFCSFGEEMGEILKQSFFTQGGWGVSGEFTKNYNSMDNLNSRVITDVNYKVEFQRPTLENPYNDGRINLPPINYNLPLDELIDYVSQIKKEFHKVKTPLELLSEELNIKKQDFKNMSSKEWADNFYMYDYFRYSKEGTYTKYQKIQEYLTIYNGYKIEKTKLEYKAGTSKSKIIKYEVYNALKKNYKGKKVSNYYSIATIKNRIKLMKELIENLKYLTLL